MTKTKEIAEIDYSQCENEGNEHLTSEDFQIPHIKILEATSPTFRELNSTGHHTAPGDIYLSSREQALKEITFIPLHYITVFSVWGDKDELIGTFRTKEDAANHLDMIDKPAGLSVQETGQNILLMINEDLSIDHPVMLYLSKSRLQVNKALNTKIKIMYPNKAPRYAGIWSLSSKERSNDKGVWHVPKFEFQALCSKDLFDIARDMYKDITKNVIENTYRIY